MFCMLHMSYFSYLSPNILCRSHCISHENCCCFDDRIIFVSPVRSTYGGYYGLVVVTPPPRPQTLHRSHDNLKNPYRIASIFYM